MTSTLPERCGLLSALTGLLLLVGLPDAAAQPKPDPTSQFINDYLAKQWKGQKLTPSDRSSDEEFIRRAMLDIVGRIATPEEVRAFVKDPSPDKRAKLVDQLLATPEYAHYWAGTWTNWLVPRGSLGPVHKQQLYFWLKDQFAAAKPSHKDLVEKLVTASGSNAKNGAVNFIVAHRGQLLAAGKKPGDEGPYFDMVPLTSRSVRLFLGYRLVAYQLPDHPVHPDYKPEQFWSVCAFFRQTEVWEVKQAMVAPPPWEVKDDPGRDPKVTFPDKEGRTQTAALVFLDGRKPAEAKQPRRQALAGFITSHDNFAKAYVNRAWGHFFGRGLHERPAVDDFGSHHKLVHPELLDRLAKDFTAGGYDPKKLIRSICSSDAYQLKSVSNITNAREEAEFYFSRMPLKIVAPEQLLESLLVSIKGDEGMVRKLRASGLEQIARRLGDADWDDQPAQERIIQNVVLINRKEINDAILTAKTGPVARAMALGDPGKIIEELYLSALNRRPTDKEAGQIKALIAKEKEKDLTSLWQDLYWALLNSSEFILNH